MSGAAIAFQGVEKHYRAQRVLEGIDLEVRGGETLGLVGVNGAGKSTLIKCLLDFTHLSAGSIHIFGTDSTRPRSRAGLAYLPEKFVPPYYLTGRDFLRYMGRLYSVSHPPGELDALLAHVDFDPAALSKPVRQLSKGMSQKLGLAACLFSGKRLLVLDEPMSGLDPRARACLKHCLAALRQAGRTVFFSTHLLADVESLCDRVAILHQGRLRFAGTPAQCCEAYGEAAFEQAYLRCVGAGPPAVPPVP